MSRLRLLALALGLALLVAVIAFQGARDIATSLAAAGPAILLLVPLFIIPLALASLAWAQLFPPHRRPGLALLLRATWTGMGVNWLLPVAQIGGDILRAAIATRAGTPASDAYASVLADKTLQFLAQVVLAALALALLIDRGTAGNALILSSFAALALLAALLAAFWIVQQRGVSRLPTRLVRRLAPRSSRGSDDPAWILAFDNALRAVRARRARLLAGATLHLAFRLSLTLEVWLVMAMLGQPISLADALILEGLSQAARAAAFLIPAGIGAQEGAFALLAPALAIAPEQAIAISLAKRVRELLVGIPPLVVLQTNALRKALA